MSTKIYTGFRLDCSIDQAVPLLQECREAMEPKVKSLFVEAQCNAITELATRLGFDGDSMQIVRESMYPEIISRRDRKNLDRCLERPLYWANCFVHCWAKQNEFTIFRTEMNVQYHFDLNLCLYPYEGKTYGVAFGADHLIEMFLHLPQVNDFHYQNQTDQPENISDEEWAERGRIWDEILGAGTFAENGLQYKLFGTDCFNSWPFLEKEELTQYLLKQRDGWVERMVRTSLTLRNMEAVPQEEWKNVSCYLEANRKATEEMKRGSKYVDELRTAFSTKFPSSYEECLAIIQGKIKE